MVVISVKSNNFALYVLMFNMFIAMAGIGLIIPIMPEYLGTFGVAGQVLGFLVAMFSFSQFIFSPIAGDLSDKHGRKKLIIIGLIIFGLSQLAFGTSTELWMLLCRTILFRPWLCIPCAAYDGIRC